MSKCGECLSENTLVNGICRLCGWKAPTQVTKEQRRIQVKYREYLPDDLLQAEKERIAEMKASDPNWRQTLAAETSQAVKKLTALPEKKQRFLEYRAELEEKVPMASNIRKACDSMPAPHDKEGYREWIEALKYVQHALPKS